MGKGVISTIDIKKGRFVLEYKGVLISNKSEATRRIIQLTAEGKESYVMLIRVKNGKKNWLVNSHLEKKTIKK